ncbi:MAG: SMC-Scp complex subunit ScpB [Candidatus Moraniibacteriota bacterium]|nr:MAG: SMC-Scp complex subunit ScpB [Candidatus Moranbacteria bacterium]
MDIRKTVSIVEALLFVSGDPVSVSRLAEVAEVPEEDMEAALEVLQKTYVEDARGLFLIRQGDGVVLTSHPDCAAFVERFVRSERESTLSRAALETLAIVAYRGPIGRAEIDAIRGVNSAMTLRNLLLRGLVERRGNPDDARGYLYGPTLTFLETIGVSCRSELPDFETLSKDERLLTIVAGSNEGNPREQGFADEKKKNT